MGSVRRVSTRVELEALLACSASYDSRLVHRLESTSRFGESDHTCKMYS
jgi:hypothetical protein